MCVCSKPANSHDSCSCVSVAGDDWCRQTTNLPAVSCIIYPSSFSGSSDSGVGVSVRHAWGQPRVSSALQPESCVFISNIKPSDCRTGSVCGATMGQWVAGLSFNQGVEGSIPALVDVSLSKTLNPELLPVARSVYDCNRIINRFG